MQNLLRFLIIGYFSVSLPSSLQAQKNGSMQPSFNDTPIGSPKPLDHSSPVNSQELFTNPIPIGNKKSVGVHWREAEGKVVEVQGLAWGDAEKGYGDSVILMGARIYVEDARFLERELQGKVVKVRGTLKVEQLKGSNGDTAGSTIPLTIFRISPISIVPLEKATWPWMIEASQEQKLGEE